MANLTLNTKEIAKVNNVAIMAGNDSKKLVPIKPICEALGIDIESQRKKIKTYIRLRPDAYRQGSQHTMKYGIITDMPP